MNFNLAEADKATEYQERLDALTQEWEGSVDELCALRRKLAEQRPALIVRSKGGIVVQDGDVKRKIIPSNKEEREAVVEMVLGELIVEEKNLELKIHYLENASRNLRQLLSAEQTRMSAGRVIAEAMNAKQL